MRVLSSGRALLNAVAVSAAAALAPTGAYALDVDVGLFYDDLAPYGTWYDSPQYGWVFAPRVDSGWQPYTVGQWVWTDDYGWLWASEEDFGWATFHYGRWYQDPALGWAWVPGTEWGPSWVSHRYGGDYIGWAPLPPRVGWAPGVGLQVGSGGIDTFIQPSYYTFVPAQAFVNPNIRRYAVPVSQNPQIIRVTRNVTNYSAPGGRVMNRSVSVAQVEKVAGRRVHRARTVEVDSVKAVRKARVKDDRIQVFKPVVRAARAKAPARGKPLPSTTAARRDASDRENEQRAAAQRRAEEARRQAEADRKREADRQREAARQRAADQEREADRQREAARQRATDQKREADRRRDAEQRATAQRRADEAKRQAEARAEQQRQAEARRQLEREEQDRRRQQIDQRRAHERRQAKEQARQQPDKRKAVVSREKRATPPPDKKQDAKKKKPDEKKPPRR